MSTHEKGLTIIEVCVASVLLVFMTSISYGAITFLHAASGYGDAKLRQEASYREVLHRVREELRQATLDNDPRTGQPRWRIGTDAAGRPTLSFQKVAGAAMIGNELQLAWSPPVTFGTSEAGEFWRQEQGGPRQVLARGIVSADFAVVGLSFRMTMITRVRDRRDGSVKDYTDQINVRPAN